MAGPGRIWIEPSIQNCGTVYPVPDDELTSVELTNRAQRALEIEQAQIERARHREEIARTYADWESKVVEQLRSAGSDAGRAALVMAGFTTVRELTHTPWEKFYVGWCQVQKFLPEQTINLPEAPDSYPDKDRNLFLNQRAFWNHDEVQEWFVEHVVTLPTHDRLVIKSRGLFGEKQTRQSAWLFLYGSTFSHPKHDWPHSLAILANGQRGQTDGYLPKSGDPVEGFNARALQDMANLYSVSLPPRPASPTLTDGG